MTEHGIKHSRSQGLIDFAYRFAREAHGDQKRKYTGEPYINHPVAVARMVADITDDCNMICAALLHDVVEDTRVTLTDIEKAGFGFSIAYLVSEVTDISCAEDGNRALRKELDRQHMAKASPSGKTIKLADLIDNTSTIVKFDPEFAKVYMKEKTLLLEALKEGSPILLDRAIKIVEDYNR